MYRFLVLFIVVFTSCRTTGPNFAAAGASFVAGASHGLNQTVWHKYPQFKRTFPNAKDQFWDPRISWQNKYESNLPIWFTDAHHLTNSTTQVSCFAAGGLTFANKRKKKTNHLFDILLNFSAYTFGNILTYNVLPNMK